MASIARYDADGKATVVQVGTLEDAQVQALERVAQQFDAAVAAGMVWQARGLQIDDDSRANMMAMTLAAQMGILPADFAWRMADNGFLPLDAAAMQAMGAAAMAHYLGLRRRLWAARDAARAAKTIAEADAITF